MEFLGMKIDDNLIMEDYKANGGQPAGSKASKAKRALKKEEWEGYTKNTKKTAY